MVVFCFSGGTCLTSSSVRLNADASIAPFVFHLDGQPIGQFRKSWKTACKSLGLSELIPHDLGRTAIRNMVRAVIPERVAMSLSGHKTRAIFDRYNIVCESDLAEATDRLHVHLRGQAQNRKIGGMKFAPKAAS